MCAASVSVSHSAALPLNGSFKQAIENSTIQIQIQSGLEFAFKKKSWGRLLYILEVVFLPLP